MSTRFRVVAVVTMIALAGCGGGSTSPTPPPPPPPAPSPVATVVVAPATATLRPVQTAQLAATTMDAAGNQLNGRTVAWGSSNNAAATVNNNGLVTAVAAGSATISATSEGKTGSAEVTVLAPVAAVAVTPATGSLLVGANLALTATPKDAAGNSLAGRPVSWTTSAPSVATVSDVGIVTAIAPGSVTITATVEGKSGSAAVTVLAPVANVVVSPGAASAVVGNTVALTASVRDAANNPLIGRVVAWSSGSPGVATVDATGLVTTVSAGTATITATSEGKSGSAQVTALAPIASVTVFGNFGPKVGDSYSYTPTLRLADGSVVVRPYSFSIQETGKGTMTPDGTLVPLQTGIMTLVVTVDGTVWTTTAVAYDWQDLSSGGAVRVALRSDATITNKFGTSEHPNLIISCTASGYLWVYVTFNNFVTANGLVAYNFDGGGFVVATWDELPPSYGSLWHPGLTNVPRRAFAAVLASARRWAFAFTEFNSTSKGMLFRVTGLTPRVAPIIAACPSNSQVVDGTALDRDRKEVMRLTGGSGPVAADAQARAQGGPQAMRMPALSGLSSPDGEKRAMIRRR